jgi:hypothetical protein
MKKIILLIFSMVGIALLQSCQYEWLDPIDTVVPDTVSFSVDIIPIFNNDGCDASGCHAPGGIAPDLTSANAYSSLMSTNMINTAAPENSTLYTKVATGGSMNKFTKPGNPDIILKWIQQGALNN